jgi:beta-lactam-binding protein with PASTA domain
MNKYISKLASPIIWGNLLAIFIVALLLLWGAKVWVDIYTHHGEEVEVPDIKGKGLNDAEYRLERVGLDYEVIDSSYNRSLPAGAVIAQTPEPGAKVKEGRCVFLTINAFSAPMVTIPNIANNCSLRAAEQKLRSMGLRLTPVEYVEGDKDWVLSMRYKGRPLYNGDRVPREATITLLVGKGTDENDSISYEVHVGEGDSSEGEASEPEGVDDLFQ